MLKRLTIALAALAIGLLPLTAAIADDHEAPAPEEVAEPVVEEADEGENEVADEEVGDDDGDEEQVAAAELEEVEEELEADEDETHGEIVSTVAQCAPRGKLLKGTGVNHGTFVSAVAGGDTVVVPAVVEGEVDVEGGEEFTVETVEDAEALCEALEAFAFDLEVVQAGDEEVVVEPAPTDVENGDDADDAAVTSAKDNRSKGNQGKGGKKDR